MTRSVRGEESDEGFDPLWGDLDEEEAFEEFLDLVAYEQVIAEGGPNTPWDVVQAELGLG